MNENIWPFILICGGLLVFLLAVSFFSQRYSLNNIKSKTVGDGQHGTARWATPKEIRSTYHVVPFRPRRWRKGIDLPKEQGVILGSMGNTKKKRPDRTARLPRKVLEKLRRPATPRREPKRMKQKKKRSRVKNFIEDQQDIRALVDSDDIHCLMIGASGVGKTAYFLYPNLEYACACGMSFLALESSRRLS